MLCVGLLSNCFKRAGPARFFLLNAFLNLYFKKCHNLWYVSRSILGEKYNNNPSGFLISFSEHFMDSRPRWLKHCDRVPSSP